MGRDFHFDDFDSLRGHSHRGVGRARM